MRFILCLIGGLAMAAAVAAIEPTPIYPTAQQIWLPEVPVLGPIPARFQDAGHSLHEQDADAYCFNPETSGSQARQREQDPHGHRCACHLVCQVGAAGEITGDHESNECKTYCLRDICRCHVESPCEMPQ